MAHMTMVTEMKAGDRHFARHLPDGTRTARAKAETRARQLARRMTPRTVLPIADEA